MAWEFGEEGVNEVVIKVNGEIVDRISPNALILPTIKQIAEENDVSRATIWTNRGELSPPQVNANDTFASKGITEIDMREELQGANFL